MRDTATMRRVIEVLRRGRRFVLSGHVNVDSDSLGSQLALAELLKGLGKTAYLIDDSDIAPELRFLPGVEQVRPARALRGLAYDAAVTMDVPDPKRLGRMATLLQRDVPLINIDHHISNLRFGTINWVDPQAAAAGELIYRLFAAMRRPITPRAALCLYVAILTDTGSFRHSNTTPEVHHIAAELMEHGVRPAWVYERLYERRTLAQLRLLGEGVQAMRTTAGGRIAWVTITRAMLRRTGGRPSSEAIVDVPRSLDGVHAVFVMREQADGDAKVSLRSKGGLVDVNRVARSFGGGGHQAASGCLIPGPIRVAERRLLARLRAALQEQ
ncbi:MAG: bifunctional oligoribonuclease/PAP phosphatase NrnA [Candidatus Omnitrophica bacterium]|nr:bifunctional oligoribonuclease/PAP phosphatase NrnA [Candidatus Omnitrophota bacterium]